jgi:hypothetical protein
VIDAGYQNACVLGHSLHRRAGDSYSIHRLLVKSSDGGPRLLRRIRTEFVSPRTVMTSALRLPWRGYRSLTTARECR